MKKIYVKLRADNLKNTRISARMDIMVVEVYIYRVEHPARRLSGTI